MDQGDGRLDAIVLLEKHERALGYLYETYAKMLPEHEEFWNDLSVQERSHAFMIETFRKMILDGSLAYEKRDFDVPAINASMLKLSRHLDFARRNEINILQALSAAMEMEGGLVECDLFCTRPGDPDELTRVLEALRDDTSRHFHTVKDLRDKLAPARAAAEHLSEKSP